jgi:hypothetical protein
MNPTCLNCSCIRTWALALALTLAVLGGLETFYRHRGHRPTVSDDLPLWAFHRNHVYGDAFTSPVVCLGDCRMLLDFVPGLLENRLRGCRVEQLSVVETSPMATLRDLARDRAFHGVVLCGLTEREFCEDVWETQQDYVDFYHRQFDLNIQVNRMISAFVQEHTVLLHPSLRLDGVLSELAMQGSLPRPYYLETHFDRSRLADYAAVDLGLHRTWALRRLNWLLSEEAARVDPATWLGWALRSEPFVKAIQDRGGSVVFIRFPTSGSYYSREQDQFPKATYWDAFAAKTSAKAIHFKDYPTLAGFSCPDTSHLDRRDAPRFTLELIDILEEEGVLGNSPAGPPSLPGPRPESH